MSEAPTRPALWASTGTFITERRTVRTLHVAIILAGTAAVAVVVCRSRPADSAAAPLFPQVDQPPRAGAGVDEPVASAQQRSVLTRAPDVEEEESVSESPLETKLQADESGMTPQQKLESLLAMHRMLVELPQDAPSRGAARRETMFAAICVKTIMCERGRADYGDPAELERLGGFSLRPSSPDEWVFAADRARYSFMKGEFPAYDMARARQALSRNGEPVLPLTPEQQATYDALFEEALASLGVSDISDK